MCIFNRLLRWFGYRWSPDHMPGTAGWLRCVPFHKSTEEAVTHLRMVKGEGAVHSLTWSKQIFFRIDSGYRV